MSFSPHPPSNGLIGHRGLAALAPENTLSSFLLAAKYGLEWIEFDLRLTQDNNLVIFHDETLNRTTNHQGKLAQCTTAKVKSLDAGSWFSPEFKNEPIPFFTEILPKLLNLNIYLNIELKLSSKPTIIEQNTLAQIFLKTLKTHWPKQKPWQLISCAHWPLLMDLRAHIADLPLGFLSNNCNASIIRHLKTIPNAAFHCYFKALTEPMIAHLKVQQIPFLAYTVNNLDIANSLLKSGAFAIFSDFPLK